MHEVTIGKLRGLQQLSDAYGIVTVTALDHRGSLKEALRRTLGRPIDDAEVVAEKLRMTRILAPHSSAVLLDPIYGAAPAVAEGAIPGAVGLLVALEASGYGGDEAGRLTSLVDGWSVAKIKRMGACAVKLLLYYHPDAPTASHQEALVRQVAAECRAHDIAFLLEPMSYPVVPGQEKSSPAFARQKPEIVLESVRRLAGLGIDLLKAEFPDDPHWQHDERQLRAHCRALTASCPVPWVILSAAETFDVFQRLVEIACEEGASGFMVGRAIWQEALQLAEPSDRERFLGTIAVSRLEILKAIATYRGRPWTSLVRVEPVEVGWHERYAAPAAVAA